MVANEVGWSTSSPPITAAELKTTARLTSLISGSFARQDDPLSCLIIGQIIILLNLNN